MDPQGFAPVSVARTPHIGVNKGLRPQHAPEVMRAVEAREASADARIAAARKVQFVANMPFHVMFAGFVLTPVAWVASKTGLSKTATVLKAPGAALEALRTTTIADMVTMPAAVVNNLSHAAQSVGGKAAEQWAPSLATRGEGLAMKVTKNRVGGAMQSFGGRMARMGERGGAAKWAVNAAQHVGRWPLLAGTTLIAAIAGTAAIWGERNKKNREVSRAFADLQVDLGTDHPITRAAHASFSKQASRSTISAGLETAGEAAFVAMEAYTSSKFTAGMGGFGLMGAMGAMGISQMIVPEHPLLNAHAVLKAESQGKAKLNAADRTSAVLQLLGAMPQEAAKGGPYNRLAHAEAQLLIKENASYAQIIDVLKDSTKHEALMARASGAMAEAANHAQASPKGAAEVKPMANGHANEMVHAGAGVNSSHLGAQPATTVSMAGAANDGRIHAPAKTQGHG